MFILLHDVVTTFHQFYPHLHNHPNHIFFHFFFLSFSKKGKGERRKSASISLLLLSLQYHSQYITSTKFKVLLSSYISICWVKEPVEIKQLWSTSSLEGLCSLNKVIPCLWCRICYQVKLFTCDYHLYKDKTHFK